MMLLMISLLAAFSGFTALSVSMRKHQRDIWKNPLKRELVLALRIVGLMFFVLSWNACSEVWGAGAGTVAWICCIGLAPIVLAFSLAYAPKPSAFAGGAAGVISGCMALIALVSR